MKENTENTGEMTHSEKSELRPAKLRDLLYDQIVRPYPFYDPLAKKTKWQQTFLELPVEGVLPAFADILISDWCESVGVGYRINRDPIACFKCKTTIIFWPTNNLQDETILNTDYDDADL